MISPTAMSVSASVSVQTLLLYSIHSPFVEYTIALHVFDPKQLIIHSRLDSVPSMAKILYDSGGPLAMFLNLDRLESNTSPTAWDRMQIEKRTINTIRPIAAEA